ncbi:MAG: hypothetical protein ACLQNE_40130 [Thermoguttaceae bacterium]
MSSVLPPAMPWMLDSSTFIHAVIVDRVMLLASIRFPLSFPEFIFRFELGSDARPATRDAAAQAVGRKQIGVQQLTLADLDRLSQLAAPRRIGLGELACAIIAERLAGGVLCDDWHAKKWIEGRVTAKCWDSIEGVFLEAAASGHIGELDLVDLQKTLETNRYHCRCDLRLEHLQRLLHGGMKH